MLITNSSAVIAPASSSTTNAAAAAPTFQEAPKPLIYLQDWRVWALWGAVLVVVLVAAYFIWRWWRKKVEVIAPPIPPHVRARQKLEEALRMISEPERFTVLVSGALREYLEERFNFRAPERTTDEFLYELQDSRLLTREQKESLADFLANCDLIKFAKYEPTEMELRDLHRAALRLVNETEPRVVPENAGSAAPPANPPGAAVPAPNPQSALE